MDVTRKQIQGAIAAVRHALGVEKRSDSAAAHPCPADLMLESLKQALTASLGGDDKLAYKLFVKAMGLGVVRPDDEQDE